MVDLAVERLRTRGTRAAAESLLRRAVPDSVDRSVLIVRRLSVDPADPGATRERLTELRRTADRPHPGTLRLTGGPSDAVLFCDEAQLLACLILDLISDDGRPALVLAAAAGVPHRHPAAGRGDDRPGPLARDRDRPDRRGRDARAGRRHGRVAHGGRAAIGTGRRRAGHRPGAADPGRAAAVAGSRRSAAAGGRCGRRRQGGCRSGCHAGPRLPSRRPRTGDTRAAGGRTVAGRPRGRSGGACGRGPRRTHTTHCATRAAAGRRAGRGRRPAAARHLGSGLRSAGAPRRRCPTRTSCVGRCVRRRSETGRGDGTTARRGTGAPGPGRDPPWGEPFAASHARHPPDTPTAVAPPRHHDHPDRAHRSALPVAPAAPARTR